MKVPYCGLAVTHNQLQTKDKRGVSALVQTNRHHCTHIQFLSSYEMF